MQIDVTYRTLEDVIYKEKEIYSQFNVAQVKSLPSVFYCGWLPEGNANERKLKADTIKKCQSKEHNGCWNHWVGLPTLKFDDESESQGVELYNYEQRFLMTSLSTNYYALNKCRGYGASEIKTVRWNSFKYANMTKLGRKALIIAGINEDLARVFMHRIKELCDRHPEIYLFQPKSDYPSEIFYKQGGSIWTLPARKDSIRSLENVGDVDYEESSFWNLNDDKPVLKAGEPHVAKSQAHINNISTPNGRRGYMWESIFDPELGVNKPPTKYTRQVGNWREVVGIPEPNPEILKDIDVHQRDDINKFYINKYEKDAAYRQWFHNFFPGREIKSILAVDKPILDIKEIYNVYMTDRATYDQEFDNQFIISENRAFGDFVHENFEPEEFE